MLLAKKTTTNSSEKDNEDYFRPYREQVVGIDLEQESDSGKQRIVYTDWAASGRLYKPIEKYMTDVLGPYVANTHTETTLTGCTMTSAYWQAKKVIKQHVGANETDVLLFDGFGMTSSITRLQRILGLRVCEKHRADMRNLSGVKPLVIITHMEHHSNQTTWQECEVDVEIVQRGPTGKPDLNNLERILQSNQARPQLFGSFSGCSNVTGILSPCHEMAELMHRHGGYAFIDFATAAPYVDINMHPDNPHQRLDAVFISPHKFLGGPGSSGIAVFNSELYQNEIPDRPGGGTVKWTNPWGEQSYVDDIEEREDGGTPGFLQAIRAALAMKLKEQMGVDLILAREHNLATRLLEGLKEIPGINVLESEQTDRIGVVSFYMDNVHFNLVTRLLNDHFGIQARGGCSCAGTYGHILLGVDKQRSRDITGGIDRGSLAEKPGWVRFSLHPVLLDSEIDQLIEAVRQIQLHHQQWSARYTFNVQSGDYVPIEKTCDIKINIDSALVDYGPQIEQPASGLQAGIRALFATFERATVSRT